VSKAIQGEFFISPADIPAETPRDVRAALELLQAHGFTILREPVSAVATTISVTATSDVEDANAQARATSRMLFPAVGRAVAAVAALSVNSVQDTREITATVYLVRPKNSGGLLDALTKEFANDGTRDGTRTG
jgi:hypothetical protein